MKRLVLVLCCFCASAPGQSLGLAHDGKGLADIVVGGSAGRPAGQAAADLASYLKRITGAEFALIKETLVKEPSRPLIVVGAGKLAAVASRGLPGGGCAILQQPCG